MKISVSVNQFISLILLIISMVLLLAGVSSAIIFVPFLFFATINAYISSRQILYGLTEGLLLCLLIIAGLVEFPMFPQAEALYSVDTNVFYWLSIGHEHAIRLLVVYPGVILGEYTHVGVTFGVTCYSASLLILTLLCMFKMLDINNVNTRLSYVLCCAIILVLSLAMNGRLIFVFFGITLLAVYELKYINNECSIIILQEITALAIAFATVSSGTMFVAITYAVLITPYRWKELKSKREKVTFTFIMSLSLIPIVGILLPYAIRMAQKNILYFGGGISGIANMMQHGLGKYLYSTNHSIIYLLMILAAIIVLINIYLFKKYVINKNNPNTPLLLMVNLSVYGSVFGLSTGLTALIPFMVLLIQKLSRRGLLAYGK